MYILQYNVNVNINFIIVQYVYVCKLKTTNKSSFKDS